MTEERVTLAILEWLQASDWQIICYDFPQSGTGRALHLNSDLRGNTKNKGIIIPDVVCIKKNVVLFFENKNRFFALDFEKCNRLRNTDDYSESIERLLKEHPCSSIRYGVGLPNTKLNISKSLQNQELVDFVILVSLAGDVTVLYDAYSVFN